MGATIPKSGVVAAGYRPGKHPAPQNRNAGNQHSYQIRSSDLTIPMKHLSGSFVYNQVAIRDRGDMLNLTDMWKACGSPKSREPFNWSRFEGSDFIGFVALAHNLSVAQVMETRINVIGTALDERTIKLTITYPGSGGIVSTTTYSCHFTYDEEASVFKLVVPTLSDMLRPMLGDGFSWMTDSEKIHALRDNSEARDIIAQWRRVTAAEESLYRIEHYPVRIENTAMR